LLIIYWSRACSSISWLAYEDAITPIVKNMANQAVDTAIRAVLKGARRYVMLTNIRLRTREKSTVR
jgi:hypothetical protein